MSQFNSSKSSSDAPDNKSRRLSRVEKTLSEVIGQYLSQVNHLFRGTLVTLVRVSVAKDLRDAKVFISVYGGDAEDVFYELDEMRPEIQRKIAKEIRMKFCPKLDFVHDDGIDKLTKFSNLLNNAAKDSESTDESDLNSDES